MVAIEVCRIEMVSGEERREEKREMKEGKRGIDKEDGEGKKKREGYGEIEMSR